MYKAQYSFINTLNLKILEYSLKMDTQIYHNNKSWCSDKVKETNSTIALSRSDPKMRAKLVLSP